LPSQLEQRLDSLFLMKVEKRRTRRKELYTRQRYVVSGGGGEFVHNFIAMMKRSEHE
jgi:hypothetical protein